MMEHTSFHEAFTDTLKDSSKASSFLLACSKTTVPTRSFDIYRNNRAVSLIDALRSTYPAVVKLVGEEFFKASARAFIDVQPPVQPVMAEYGKEFGQFVASLPNTDKLPFLEAVAAIDWYRLQAYHCIDAPVLTPSALAEIEPQSIMDIRLTCHPALECVTSNWPVGSIWTICTSNPQDDSTAHNNIDMQTGEVVVITRPQLQVMVNRIDGAAAIFLKAIQEGDTLGDSASLALESDPKFNAGEHLAGLMTLGSFSAISSS